MDDGWMDVGLVGGWVSVWMGAVQGCMVSVCVHVLYMDEWVGVRMGGWLNGKWMGRMDEW